MSHLTLTLAHLVKFFIFPLFTLNCSHISKDDQLDSSSNCSGSMSALKRIAALEDVIITRLTVCDFLQLCRTLRVPFTAGSINST